MRRGGVGATYYPIRTSTDPLWTKSFAVSFSCNDLSILGEKFLEESICSMVGVVCELMCCCVVGIVISEIVWEDSVTSGSFITSKICSVSVSVESFGGAILDVWKFNLSEFSSNPFWLNPFWIKYQSPMWNPQSWLGSKDNIATIYKN